MRPNLAKDVKRMLFPTGDAKEATTNVTINATKTH